MASVFQMHHQHIQKKILKRITLSTLFHSLPQHFGVARQKTVKQALDITHSLEKNLDYAGNCTLNPQTQYWYEMQQIQIVFFKILRI